MWMGALTVMGDWPKAPHLLGTQLQTRFSLLVPGVPLQISEAKLMPRIEGTGWVSLLFALCLRHID